MLNNENIKLPQAIKNQIKWRNKQIKVYYEIGRPIFDYHSEKNYIIYNNRINKKNNIFIL